MIRPVLLSVFVAVIVVVEGAWGEQQQRSNRLSFSAPDVSNQQAEELSNLKLLVPLLRVEDDEIPETESWRADSKSSSEEDSEAVNAALSRLLAKLSGKPSSQASSARPRVYNIGVHDHLEHQGRPCPVCLFLNALKAIQQSQRAENRLDNRNQKQGVTFRVQRGKQHGSGSQRGQQRLQREGQRDKEATQTCAVSVIELENDRRANDPQDVGPQDGAPKDKPPTP